MASNQKRLAAVRKPPWLALHAEIRAAKPLNPLIHQSRRDKLTPRFGANLRKLG
jgi:hypothetical protein